MRTADTLEVVEVFRSLQGEGQRTGRVTTFVRLAGCDLACPWCDTDHKMRELVTVSDLVERVGRLGPTGWVCITGGEPGVHDRLPMLVDWLKRSGYKVQVETNGLVIDLALAGLFDLVTVSPKLHLGRKVARLIEEVRQMSNTELKVVVDQHERPWFNLLLDGWRDDSFFDCPIYLQPMSCGPEETRRCVNFVEKMGRESVRLSLQVQKILSIP